MRVLLLGLGLILALSGCAVPTAVTIASFAADGVSYIATGKSTTDHALSVIAQEDCAMLRALEEKAICVPDGNLPLQTAKAEPEEAPPAPAPSPAHESKDPAPQPKAWDFALVQKDTVSKPGPSGSLQLVEKGVPARVTAAPPVQIAKRLRPMAPRRAAPPFKVGRIVLSRCYESIGMQPAAQCSLGPGA